MPRRPELKTIHKTVVINKVTIPVTLYPPKPPRTSWYAYWPSLGAAKSTRQSDPNKATEAVVGMLQNNGKLGQAHDLVLSDEEFEEIQRRHFGKKKDPAAANRTKKSLRSCLEAISAFRDIAGVRPVARAEPGDCERFQSRTLTLPKDWRRRHDPESVAARYSSNTVIKWSRELQAAFERANRNAGKKCVRGVVNEQKLLTENPWCQFTWIEGVNRPIRQFEDAELTSLLDYLATEWAGVPIATTLAKTCLWSWDRREQITALQWDSLKLVEGEIHFEIIGKWGVEKWFRVPDGLYAELLDNRTDSHFVFDGYVRQLKTQHQIHGCPTNADLVRDEFKPDNLGKWFERRLIAWSGKFGNGRATMHIFRKTALQYARRGEDVNAAVARDARVGASVMMRHYIKEADPERRAASNRTFYRIAASLNPETVGRYGHRIAVKSREELEREIQDAVSRKDYQRVGQVSAELAGRRGQ